MLEVNFGLSTPGLEDNQKCCARERAHMLDNAMFPDKIWMKNRDSKEKPQSEAEAANETHEACV